MVLPASHHGHNQLELRMRQEMNDVLYFSPDEETWNDSHDLWQAEAMRENLSYFAQKANGLEFDEEIEEFEE